MKIIAKHFVKGLSHRLPAALSMALTFLLISTAPASAYIGPGAGITAIGTVLALIGAVLLAIVGFLWYPIRRFLRNRRAKQAELAEEKPAEKDAVD